MKTRWKTLIALTACSAVFALAGCEGDDGDDGDPGPQGATGLACWDLNENGVPDLPDEDLNGDGVVDVLDCNALANQPDADVQAAIASAKIESCTTCHTGAGEDHTAIYEKYVDESRLVLTIDPGDVLSIDNLDGTYTVIAEFSITFDGAPYNDPGLAMLDQKRFYAVQYFSATGEYLNSCSMGALADVNPAAGIYSATDDDCSYAPELSDAQVYGYIAQTPLLTHPGGTGAELPAGTHVHLYDDVSNAAAPFGAAAVTDAGAYVSAANVSGCEKCHGSPYLKHGYRAAQVDGIPDFAACKSCHYDNRNGGHGDWQFMVDDPFAWATGEDPTADYSYTANIMNDTHMSHAMEFPYPQSAASCVTCHEGKLDVVLAEEQFTATTCKSCHPVTGTDAWPALGDDPAEDYYQTGRAPALEYLWVRAGVESFHNIGLNCQNCHTTAGGVPVFSEYHSGYDPRIYDATGQRYADLHTVSIDDVSLNGDLMTIEFSSNDTAIIPEVSVSFYGYDTKDFLVSGHTRDATRARMEYVPESSGGDPNPLFTEEAGSAPGAWTVTLDMAAFQAEDTDSIPDLIASGTVRKAEIGLTPELEVDGIDVGLNAKTRTVDLDAGMFTDNYFKGTDALVDVDKCNVCHDQLAVTFHSGSGRGGDITMCRVCHVTTSGGSHLEMQSRSIDSYIHSIHSFQALDTDEDFETFNPVDAARYDQHIKHVFPRFTINNCEACHVDSGGASEAVTYNPPDQRKSMPGLLSGSWDLGTWYTFDADGVVMEDTSGRAIGDVPEYVVGATSKACGGCHRARLINQDEAAALASWNSHTQTNGTYSPNDEDDKALYGIIEKIMTMFE